MATMNEMEGNPHVSAFGQPQQQPEYGGTQPLPPEKMPPEDMTESDRFRMEPPWAHYKGGGGPFRWWLSMCLVGMGMFMEAYIVITTGQMKSVFGAGYPTCYDAGDDATCPNNIRCTGLFDNEPANLKPDPSFCNADGSYPSSMTCGKETTEVSSYASFGGIMLGMLTYGFIGDIIGRKWGSVLISMTMLLGAILMTVTFSPTLNLTFILFAVFFGVYGYGVGGEYPLAASTAAEKEMLTEESLPDEVKRVRLAASNYRGRAVGLAFTMQGWGAFVGALVLLILIAISGNNVPDCSRGTESGYSTNAMQWIWHVFYATGALVLASLVFYRLFVLRETFTYKQRRGQVVEHSNSCSRVALILRYYWARLLGTGGSWFLWDITFYGNKLYSGPIFAALNPGGSLILLNALIVINQLVALLGYHVMLSVIDNPRIPFGARRFFQTTGFTLQGILFLLTAIFIDSGAPPGLLVAYFMSTFFGQFGPNVTTYVTSAELYPVMARMTCHGFSAFLGKAGALVGTLAFGYLTTAGIFYLCFGVSMLGAIFTIIFLPDITRLPGDTLDEQFAHLIKGHVRDYSGEAVNPKHLSFFERFVLRRGRSYVPPIKE